MYCTFQGLKFFKFVSVSWSTFVLYICGTFFKAIDWCLFVFLQVLCSPQCTVPLLCITCVTCLIWLWICSVSSAPQVICGGGRLRWDTCKAIINYIVAFWGPRLVKSSCDGCLILSSPQISLCMRKHWHLHNVLWSEKGCPSS